MEQDVVGGDVSSEFDMEVDKDVGTEADLQTASTHLDAMASTSSTNPISNSQEADFNQVPAEILEITMRDDHAGSNVKVTPNCFRYFTMMHFVSVTNLSS